MENTAQVSNKLKDRVLWHDGDITVEASKIMDVLSKGVKNSAGICVDRITPDIVQYNRLVPQHEQIRVKDGLTSITAVQQIPMEYAYLDVQNYILDRMALEATKEGLTDKQLTMRIERVQHEMSLYESFELFPVLRTLIYVINTLDTNNVVWGVGRGSSVSSYVLYLIGVHDVDSVEYDLDIRDFLR